jgi:hypothetical protein
VSLFHSTEHVAYSPLDVRVMGSFKAIYGVEQNHRMIANPEKKSTHYATNISASAYPVSLTSNNI